MTRTEGYSGRVIRMLCQQVGDFSVEPINVKFDMKNESYRRLFRESNKDAVSASWRFFGRASKRKIRHEKLIFDKD